MDSLTKQYIDLDRFPFVPSGTPEWQRLVDIHKNALEANGASIMKGAIKQDILKRMATEAAQLIVYYLTDKKKLNLSNLVNIKELDLQI